MLKSTTLAMVLSGVCLLATVESSSADCSAPVSLKTDSKELNIMKIMEYGRCLGAEQHDRVGKWFCYVADMVGIQTDENTKQVSSGRIKPAAEKFFATISELSEEAKTMMCDRGEYGISPHDPMANRCLVNFKIEFSPSMGFFEDSVDTFNFNSAYTNFTLFGTKDFIMYRGLDFHNSFASHGKCEKLN
jgi:hypothetical protein